MHLVGVIIRDRAFGLEINWVHWSRKMHELDMVKICRHISSPTTVNSKLWTRHKTAGSSREGLPRSAFGWCLFLAVFKICGPEIKNASNNGTVIFTLNYDRCERWRTKCGVLELVTKHRLRPKYFHSVERPRYPNSGHSSIRYMSLLVVCCSVAWCNLALSKEHRFTAEFFKSIRKRSPTETNIVDGERDLLRTAVGGSHRRPERCGDEYHLVLGQ